MPVPLSGPALRRCAGIERVEYLVPLVGRNPRPGIGEIDHRRRAIGISVQVDRAAARRELECIREQVFEHELELCAIRDEVQVRDVHVERQVPRSHREPLTVNHGADQRAQGGRM